MARRNTWTRVLLALALAAARGAAQHVACAGAALTGVHVYTDADGQSVRARVQCEGDWQPWATVGDGSGGRPAHQLAAACPKGEAIVALVLGAEEPLVAECATPRRSHFRLASRGPMACGRGQLAVGVSFGGGEGEEEEEGEEDEEEGPISLLCQSTLLVRADGDLERALDLSLDDLRRLLGSAALGLRSAAHAFERMDERLAGGELGAGLLEAVDARAAPLGVVLRPVSHAVALLGRACARACALGSHSLSAVLPPLLGGSAALLQGALRFLLAHRQLYARARRSALLRSVLAAATALTCALRMSPFCARDDRPTAPSATSYARLYGRALRLGRGLSRALWQLAARLSGRGGGGRSGGASRERPAPVRRGSPRAVASGERGAADEAGYADEADYADAAEGGEEEGGAYSLDGAGMGGLSRSGSGGLARAASGAPAGASRGEAVGPEQYMQARGPEAAAGLAAARAVAQPAAAERAAHGSPRVGISLGGGSERGDGSGVGAERAASADYDIESELQAQLRAARAKYGMR